VIYYYTTRRHDTRPSLYLTAVEPTGFPVDLSVYETVRFHLRQRGAALDELKVDRPAELEPESGRIRYDWQAADTDTVGVFFGEFELTAADGAKRTLPANGLIRIDVLADVNNA